MALLRPKIDEVKFWQMIKRIVLVVKECGDDIIGWAGLLKIPAEQIDGIVIGGLLDKLLVKIDELIDEAQAEEETP